MKYDLAELMKKALEENKKIFKKASDISFEKEEYLLDYYKSQSFHELRYNKINEIDKTNSMTWSILNKRVKPNKIRFNI